MIVPPNKALGAAFSFSDARNRQSSAAFVSEALGTSHPDLTELVASENQAAAIGVNISSLEQARNLATGGLNSLPEYNREF